MMLGPFESKADPQEVWSVFMNERKTSRLLGPFLGQGRHRRTHLFKPFPEFVIKVDIGDPDIRGGNADEYVMWERYRGTQCAKFLSPCIAIKDHEENPRHTWMIMLRMKPVYREFIYLPRELCHACLDLHGGNIGRTYTGGNVVLLDYGTLSAYLTKGEGKEEMDLVKTPVRWE